MTKTELDNLIAESKRLHELATKGPWERNGESICAFLSITLDGQICSLPLFEMDLMNQEDLDDEGESETADVNAHFVLHARTALPALVTEVERLRRCLDQAKGTLETLACLGRGNRVGNSTGNQIALAALRDLDKNAHDELVSRDRL